jgi:hypothetical protein
MTESTHPSPERLTAYQARELAPAEAEEIREHLAVCRECTEAVLALPRFYELMESSRLPAPPGSEGIPTQAETEASWRAMRARLGTLTPVPSPTRTPPARERGATSRRVMTSPSVTYALAAGLAACLIGFPLWIALHRGSPLALSVPGAEVFRSEAGGRLITLSASGETTVLVLPLPDRPPFPSYRIEIRSSGGDLRLSTDATLTAVAQPSPAQTPRLLTIAVPPRVLATGDYRLRILGLLDGRGEVLAEHPLRVSGP